MKSVKPSPDHEALLVDLKVALAKHEALPAIDMLAIVSIFVGQLVALQDQTRYTPNQVMDLVATNIQRGNLDAISSILGTTEGNS